MKFLLTNDDGIDAPGLATLAEAVTGLGEATIVAPDTHHSGCGHRTTTEDSIGIDRRGERRYAIDGTPADCSRVGLLHLAKDADWVLAGVNDGGNLGVDVYMSGTVAAVREAVWLGKPGIAFSQYRRKKPGLHWQATVAFVRRVLDELLSQPLPPGALWNVNFPDPDVPRPEPRIVRCPLESSHLPVRFDEQPDGRLLYHRGGYHERPRRPGSDVDVCFSGDIAVTLIHPFPPPP